VCHMRRRISTYLSIHLSIHHIHHPQVYAYVRALGGKNGNLCAQLENGNLCAQRSESVFILWLSVFILWLSVFILWLSVFILCLSLNCVCVCACV